MKSLFLFFALSLFAMSAMAQGPASRCEVEVYVDHVFIFSDTYESTYIGDCHGTVETMVEDGVCPNYTNKQVSARYQYCQGTKCYSKGRVNRNCP
jgi:hypothetical protein